MVHVPDIQKQTTYSAVAYEVKATPDGGALLIFHAIACGEAIVFPLDQPSREKIGKALLAPSVAIPGAVDGHPG